MKPTEQQPRYFFSHIPKTGGMTLRLFLENQFFKNEVCPYKDWRHFPLAHSGDLMPYSLFAGHFIFDMARFLPDAYSIVFFREPVERTISLLNHLGRDPAVHSLHDRAKGKTISQMLDDPLIVSQLRNQQTSWLGSQLLVDQIGSISHWELLASDCGAYLTDASLDLALQVLESLNFIGLTERMDESVGRLCQQFGFHPPLTLAKRNETPEQSGFELSNISDSDIDRIRAINNLDICLYEACKARFEREHVPFDFNQQVIQSFSRLNPDNSIRDDMFDLNNPMPGSNWYEPEEHSGVPVRWSGPNELSSIEWPISSEDGKFIVLELFPRRGDNLLESLTVEVDGQPASLVSIDKRIRVKIPLKRNAVSSINGFHQILFHHKNGNLPVIESADLRGLRFLLISIRMEKNTSLS
ncbi:MAG: hypothetical protein PHY16_10145 [Methylobacter sp.]|nr:hypothetical protein [Methylobacter sp.]